MWYLFNFYHFYLFVYWCVGLLQSKNWWMFNEALTGGNKKSESVSKMRDVPTLTDSYKQVTRRQLSCTAVKSFR